MEQLTEQLRRHCSSWEKLEQGGEGGGDVGEGGGEGGEGGGGGVEEDFATISLSSTERLIEI